MSGGGGDVEEVVLVVMVAARHLLEAHLLRRDQVGVVVLPRRAHVRQLLRLADVHLQVAGARVDPDDLVGVHRVVLEREEEEREVRGAGEWCGAARACVKLPVRGVSHRTGPEKRTPRSCAFISPNEFASPCSWQSRLPRSRPPNSPTCGRYLSLIHI